MTIAFAGSSVVKFERSLAVFLPHTYSNVAVSTLVVSFWFSPFDWCREWFLRCSVKSAVSYPKSCYRLTLYSEGKAKAVCPFILHTDTWACGKWSASVTGRFTPPPQEKALPIPIKWETGWYQRRSGCSRGEKINFYLFLVFFISKIIVILDLSTAHILPKFLYFCCD